MLRKKKFLFYFLIFLLSIVGINCSALGNQDDKVKINQQTLQNYIDKGNPSDGKFVVCYYKEESEGHIYYKVVYESVIEDTQLDVTNLSVNSEVLDNTFYLINLNKDDPIDYAVRLALLRQGVASISDAEDASKEELEKQQYAQDNLLGIWNVSQMKDSEEISPQESNKENLEIKEKVSAFWNRLKVFLLTLRNNAFVKWLIAPFITSAFVISVVIKIIQRRNIMLFFGGDKSAGKTTLHKAIMNESISEDELLEQSPTNATNRSRFIRDNKNMRLTLHSKIYDMPGDNNYEALNYLCGKRYRILKKTVLVIVVAPTRYHARQQSEYDVTYIQEQKCNIEKFWTAVIRAKKTKICLVILFINKSDLCSDKKALGIQFKDHIAMIRNACRISGTQFECIIGSSVKRNGVGKVFELLYKRQSIIGRWKNK